MNLDKSLRVLARDTYWQNIYNSSQKCSNISLFENNDNLSGIQVRFLYWLGTYKMLYEELSTFEDNLLTEDVINNNFRCDCYLIYRNKKQEFLCKKHREEELKANLQSKRKKQFKHSGTEQTIDVQLRRESENG